MQPSFVVVRKNASLSDTLFYIQKY